MGTMMAIMPLMIIMPANVMMLQVIVMVMSRSFGLQ